MTSRLLAQRKIAFFLLAAALLLAGGAAWLLMVRESPSVRIAYSASPVDAPLMIASSQDLWKKHDVRPELTPYTVGRLCLDAVIARTADMGTVADTPFAYAVMRGHELEILATLVTSDQHVRCVGRADAGVLTPANLKGKRLAVYLGTASEYLMSKLLAKHDIAADDVTLINMPPAEMVAAFSSGQVEAAFPFEPFTTAILAKNGDRARVLDTRGLYTMTFNLVARKGYGANNAAVVRQILAAIIDANAYIDAHPVAATEEVAKQLKLPIEPVKAYWDFYRYRVTLDSSLVALLNTEQRWIASRDRSVAGANLDFKQTIQPEPLTAIAPSAVTLARQVSK